MRLRTRPTLVFLSVITILEYIIDAGPSTTFRKLEEHFKKRKLTRLLDLATVPLPVLGSKVETNFLLQDLDQFDSENSNQFKQRYYVSSAYWNQPSGPVFLYVGGEGQLSAEVLMGGEMVELAEKYGALLFAVEHRYYGISIPVKGLKLENIGFLSSQQALADLADFYQHAVKTYKLTNENLWIAFGGSYPGALSAWLRTKFPHIVYGSVASSAPVLAETNFEGYNDVVAASLASSLVGGSTLCINSVQEAFQEVDKLISLKQFYTLRFGFASCNDISDPNDTVQFVSNLAGIFMGIVQYNNEIHEELNVRKVCGYMTNENKTVYERLIDVNKAYLQQMELECTDNSYVSTIKMLSNDTTDPTGNSMFRQWTYQTCSQFGYYQTCDKGTSCIFSNLLTLDSYLDMCQILFNISSAEVWKRVSFTNAYYGGRRPSGTRIIFVNGSIDPWHALSVLKNQTSSSEIAIYIPGTAHCANMEPSYASDPLVLKIARIKISQIIGEWLNQPDQGNDIYF